MSKHRKTYNFQKTMSENDCWKIHVSSTDGGRTTSRDNVVRQTVPDVEEQLRRPCN